MALPRSADGADKVRSAASTNNGSLRKLYLLLRNEGDRVLNGTSTFTLTTDVLSYLNDDCRRHSLANINSCVGQGRASFFSLTKRSRSQQEDNRLKAEWAYQLQFIKDFLLSTPSLKIIHNSGTLSSPISLHRFGNLSSLHLRRVQIHMVEGLQKLRSILISLTVYRGLDKLKDVLECCGGDMSAPMTWSALKFISFTFNSLTNLDESLRLVPCVQKVDLSHNLLESCESFLENLLDVLYVTLAYNNLNKVPSFSPTSRSSLVSLILRGNNLDNLAGLEVLLSLQDLDLGENYLNDHSFLAPLSTLSKLKQLQLSGNPIFYHKSHRTLTVSYLSMKAVNCEFELDKKKLSASEVHHFSPQRKLAISSPALSYENRTSTLSGSELNKRTDYRFSPSSGIGSETDSTDVIAQSSSRKSKHRRIKARKTVILDMDTSGDLSSSQGATPGTSPSVSGFKHQTSARSEEARKTKQQIEELREHYGQNWLQAIEDRNIFSKKKQMPVLTSIPTSAGDLGTKEVDSDPTTSDIITQVDIEVLKRDETTEISPTDDDLYLRETKPVEINNPNMAAIARLAAGWTQPENDQTVNISPASRTKSLPNDKMSSPSELQSTLKGSSQLKMQKPVVVSSSDNVPSSLKVFKTDPLPNSPLLAITYPAQQPSQSHYKKDDTVDIPSSALEYQTSNKDGSHKAEFVVQTSETKSDSPFQTTVDSDELTEAIFANLPDKDNKMIILSLTSSTLVEKDIRMKVIEKLDLSSLVSMDCQTVKNRRRHVSSEDRSSNGESITDEEVEVIQLDLKFNYMRKDRQTRCYQVDKEDGNNLIKYIRPILDLRESEAKVKSMVVMQCLKCNRTFLKSELVHQRKSLPTAGSSKDLQSLKSLMESPTLICPKCGSTIIIELDSSANAAKSTSSATSTPVGSYNSTGSFIEQAKPSSTLKTRNIKPRKNSTSSLDLNLSKKLNLDIFTTTTSMNSSSWTQDNLLKRAVVSSGRDRSNAFNVNSKMARSTIVHGASFSEAEELICIEDYFTEETKLSTSQQLAAMTTSLRGDLSTKGKTADVRRNSLMAFPERKTEAEIFYPIAASDSRQGDENVSSLEPQDGKPKTVTAGSTENTTAEVESEGKKATETKVPLKVAEYKNLATMEDMVKALVCEGQNLLFQETLSSSIESRENIRTVSVSAFKKSSVTHRRDSEACNDKDSLSGLKLSDSSSSITILPTPPVLETEPISLGTSVSSVTEPVKFSIGTPCEEEEHSPKNSIVSAEARVVSPLNPDICSSMVSSVYLTSVSSAQGSSSDTLLDSLDNAASSSIQSVLQDDTTLIFNNDEEDITSIYDSSWASSRVEVKSKSDSAAPSRSPKDDGAVPSSDGAYHGVNYASLAGYDTDSADDEDGTGTSEVHQNVVQYAFHHLNHHLTLYMMMSLFENDEEFMCKIQSEVVQYIIEDSYEGILVMSSCRFYVLKITSNDHSLPPDQWLTCIEIQPIPELRFVDVGLGGQSFRLEFVTDCSSYTFITRNKEKTLQFVELLHTNLAKYAVSQGISSHVIVNEDVDQTTLNNMTADVVCKPSPDQRLLLYCMGFIERGNQKLFPVSFVITTSDICLVRANHQWPQPRLQAPISVETVGKQFTVLERQRINNVASVEVCETSMKKMRLELFNEMEGISVNWNITLLNRQTTVDFINALSEPWAKEFGGKSVLFIQSCLIFQGKNWSFNFNKFPIDVSLT
ncbi:hypothetical protein Btru_051065 [Bulinus truncatus]|nr:hypothetical protein Btru_051065 [Bulinus truncatus]